MSDAGADAEDIEDGAANISGDETGSSWNIVPSMDQQGGIASTLINSMASLNLTQTPSLPAESAPSGPAGVVSGLLNKLTQDTGNSANAKANQSIVTRAIANQGQLLPIGAGAPSGGTNAPASQGDLQKVLAAIQASNQSTQSQEAATSSSKSSSSGSGGVGGIIGDVVGAVLSPFGTILCTELLRQGKLPVKWYVAGKATFLSYPKTGVQGYMLWAVPMLAHMRKYPESSLSKSVTILLLARSEYIANREGIRGARKTLGGFSANVFLYTLCRTLGILIWLFHIKTAKVDGVIA